jgi:hypothetical protein
MRTLLMGSALFLGLSASAQQVIDLSKTDQDYNIAIRAVGGEPVLGVKVIRTVEGSPYFRNQWMNTSVLLASGAQYKNFQGRLNLLDGALYYLNNKKEEFSTQNSLREIAFRDQEGIVYRFVHSRHIDAPGLKEGWYQLLTDGKARLYKLYDKTSSIQKPYGSATEEQTIRTRERYFVVQDQAVYELKKLKEAPAVLPAKKEELKTFLAAKDLEGLSTEARYKALIEYYNTLLP